MNDFTNNFFFLKKTKKTKSFVSGRRQALLPLIIVNPPSLLPSHLLPLMVANPNPSSPPPPLPYHCCLSFEPV